MRTELCIGCLTPCYVRIYYNKLRNINVSCNFFFLAERVPGYANEDARRMLLGSSRRSSAGQQLQTSATVGQQGA